jgi:ABC-type nitrate/sulfonate/bicarbonate transport system substrate-binding protein
MSHLTRAALIQGAILAASARAAFAQSEKLTTVRFNAMAADAVRPVLYGVQSGVFRQAGLDVVWERGQRCRRHPGDRRRRERYRAS